MRRLGPVPWGLLALIAVVGVVAIGVFDDWTAAAAVAGLLAVLVALFKDEFWHWLHGPTLDAELVLDPYPSTGYSVRLRNASDRVAVEGASVRVLELEPHPLEGAGGSKQMNPVILVDQLVPRRSGETRFSLAPQSSVDVALFSVGGAENDSEAAVASFPWWKGGALSAFSDKGLLVLPSIEARETYIDPYPAMRPFEDAPAMVRVEISGLNVPAQLSTVKIMRDVNAPPREALPFDPGFYIGTFSATMDPGWLPRNTAPHLGQQTPEEPQPRDKWWAKMLEERKELLDEVKRKREESSRSERPSSSPDAN